MTAALTNLDGVYHLELKSGSPLCALQMAPSHREDVLGSGEWRILCFAVWSGPDLAAVEQLEEAVKLSPNRGVEVGARPFEDHSEFSRWLPEWGEFTGSPIWLCLNSGKVEGVRLGLMTDEELSDWLRPMGVSNREKET